MDAAIVSLIDDFKAYFAIYGVMLWQMNHPGCRAIMEPDLRDPTANIGAFRKDGSRHELYIPPIIDRAATPQFNLFYMRTTLQTAIAVLADELQRKSLMDASAEMQFLRHLRNACAHGNRFYLKSGEPQKPAKFKEFTITSNLDGFSPVLYDFVCPGDVMDLFDFIKKKA